MTDAERKEMEPTKHPHQAESDIQRALQIKLRLMRQRHVSSVNKDDLQLRNRVQSLREQIRSVSQNQHRPLFIHPRPEQTPFPPNVGPNANSSTEIRAALIRLQRTKRRHKRRLATLKDAKRLKDHTTQRTIIHALHKVGNAVSRQEQSAMMLLVSNMAEMRQSNERVLETLLQLKHEPLPHLPTVVPPSQQYSAYNHPIYTPQQQQPLHHQVELQNQRPPHHPFQPVYPPTQSQTPSQAIGNTSATTAPSAAVAHPSSNGASASNESIAKAVDMKTLSKVMKTAGASQSGVARALIEARKQLAKEHGDEPETEAIDQQTKVLDEIMNNDDLLHVSDDEEDLKKKAEEEKERDNLQKRKELNRVAMLNNARPMYRWRKDNIRKPDATMILKGKSHFRAIALVIVFKHRMEQGVHSKRIATLAVDRKDLRELLAWFQEKIRSYIIKAIKIPLSDILNNKSLNLDIFNAAAGSSKKKKSDGVEQRALRLKVRVRGIFDALLKTHLDQRPPLPNGALTFLNRMMVDGCAFPESYLFERETSALLFSKSGYTRWMLTIGSGEPNSNRYNFSRPLFVLLNYIVVRHIVPIVLEPWEAGLGSKPSKHCQNNLRILASTIHFLCESLIEKTKNEIDFSVAPKQYSTSDKKKTSLKSSNNPNLGNSALDRTTADEESQDKSNNNTGAKQVKNKRGLFSMFTRKKTNPKAVQEVIPSNIDPKKEDEKGKGEGKPTDKEIENTTSDPKDPGNTSSSKGDVQHEEDQDYDSQSENESFPTLADITKPLISKERFQDKTLAEHAHWSSIIDMELILSLWAKRILRSAIGSDVNTPENVLAQLNTVVDEASNLLLEKPKVTHVHIAGTSFEAKLNVTLQDNDPSESKTQESHDPETSESKGDTSERRTSLASTRSRRKSVNSGTNEQRRRASKSSRDAHEVNFAGDSQQNTMHRTASNLSQVSVFSTRRGNGVRDRQRKMSLAEESVLSTREVFEDANASLDEIENMARTHEVNRPGTATSTSSKHSRSSTRSSRKQRLHDDQTKPGRRPPSANSQKLNRTGSNASMRSTLSKQQSLRGNLENESQTRSVALREIQEDIEDADEALEGKLESGDDLPDVNVQASSPTVADGRSLSDTPAHSGGNDNMQDSKIRNAPDEQISIVQERETSSGLEADGPSKLHTNKVGDESKAAESGSINKTGEDEENSNKPAINREAIDAA